MVLKFEHVSVVILLPQELPIEVVVVMSDTTSTLMAGNYVDKKARIGLILGV